LFGLVSRTSLEFNVLRERNPNFVRLSDGSVRNTYTLKIVNKGNAARTFTVVAEGPAAVSMKIAGQE
ncbi:MAG TPA: cytochrome c oxidase accessory protein CcoG, partial [Alphaproteobacteria bacterium]|nr:cytochrome c oxidase accessory protein CcoG [Alphaproteobacteria bacterium]